MGNYVIASEDLWYGNEDYSVTYVTIFRDGIPEWIPVEWDEKGAYVVVDDEVNYILDRN